MKCKDCGKEVICPHHGGGFLSEYQHDDGSWYYSCDKCVDEFGSAFGSIIHWCNEMFNMLGLRENKEVSNE